MSLARKVTINASALAGGRVLSSLSGLVAVGIATRYLHPDSYGALIAAIAFTGILIPLTDLGTSIIGARELAKRPDETDRLLGAIFTISALLSLAACVVGIGVMFAVYPGADHHLEREAILILLLPTLLGAPATTAGTYFISEQKAYIGAVASVIGSLALLGILAASAGLAWGFTGVAAAYAANSVVYAAFMLIFGLQRGVRMRPSLDRALCTQLLKWAVPLGLGVIVNAIYSRIDVVLLSALASQGEVGVYGLAYKVVDVLMILPAYITITLLPEFARLSEHRERLGQVTQKAFSLLQFATAPMLIVMVVFAGEVITMAGGADFSKAAPILQILMLTVLFSYLQAVCWQGLLAMNQQNAILRISLACLVVNVILNLALIPLWGGIGAAIAMAATEIAVVSFTFARFARLADVPRPVHLPQYLLAAGLGASVGLLKLVPGVDAAPSPVIFVTGGALVVVVYVAALYAMKAVPEVVRESLVAPIWARLRPRQLAARRS